MSNIIVVFPKRENAVNIRNSLVRAGIEVSAVCLTGAKVLQYADNWNDGIVVCGYRFQDMQYTDYENLFRIRLTCFWWLQRISGWMDCRMGL